MGGDRVSRRCFGFERQTVHEGPNGTLAHGELRLGTTSFGLSSASGPVTPTNPWTSVRSGIYVALQDSNLVDAHHARAQAAGAVIAMPLEDTDYGSRQYSVWDGDRRLWCFGTYYHAPFGEPTLSLVTTRALAPTGENLSPDRRLGRFNCDVAD